MSRTKPPRAWRRAAALAAAITAFAPQAGAAPAQAQAFIGQLREAATRPGGAALAELTQLPFLFEGRPHTRDAFVAQVVPALFTPAVRQCLQRARPQPEGDRLVLWCKPYAFYVGMVQGRWRVVEFGADGG